MKILPSHMKTAKWIGASFVHGIFSGLGTLVVYIIVALIIINTQKFDSLKNAFGLRFGRGEFSDTSHHVEPTTGGMW